MLVHVEIYAKDISNWWYCIKEYTMDHNNPAERRVLGEQCRNAFEADQKVVTTPLK